MPSRRSTWVWEAGSSNFRVRSRPHLVRQTIVFGRQSSAASASNWSVRVTSYSIRRPAGGRAGFWLLTPRTSGVSSVKPLTIWPTTRPLLSAFRAADTRGSRLFSTFRGLARRGARYQKFRVPQKRFSSLGQTYLCNGNRGDHRILASRFPPQSLMHEHLQECLIANPLAMGDFTGFSKIRRRQA
jgi:hypothetical protein